MIGDRFPRVALGHLPTPLERAPRLSEWLDGPEIWIKRDDCTGLASGGNKTRKLEFLLADALRQDADTLVTIGAVQSNHVRQTAAAAARCGLACHALLETEVPCEEVSYTRSGNILLDGLFACGIEYHARGTDMNALARERVESLRAQGRRPYLIPVGGSNGTGALAYVACAEELAGQFADMDLVVSRIVHATGSGGTQAGLLAGFHAAGRDVGIVGISVSANESEQLEKVRALTADTLDRLGVHRPLPESAIQVREDFIGDGYGLPTAAMREAVEQCARLEGLLLDPVYSGKAMAGLIDMVRTGELSAGNTVVFLHTGGSAGLFAYDWFFSGG